jgi:uncharacterized protein
MLTDAERLTISMLCDLQKATGVRGNYDPELIQASLFGGHMWSLRWEYHHLFEAEEDGYSIVEHVTDVLDMWWFIEAAYKKLSPKDKKALEEAVPYGGKNPQFSGYDGNNETTYMGVVQHLVGRMGRFLDLQGRSFNSHTRKVAQYSAMLRVFLPLREKLHGGVTLGVKELTAILSAT